MGLIIIGALVCIIGLGVVWVGLLIKGSFGVSISGAVLIFFGMVTLNGFEHNVQHTQLFVFEGEGIRAVDYVFKWTSSEDEYGRIFYMKCNQSITFGPFTDDSEVWMTEAYFSSSIRSGYEDEYFQKSYRRNAKHDSREEVCEVGKERVIPFLSELLDGDVYRLSRDRNSNNLVYLVPYSNYHGTRFSGDEFFVNVDSIKIVDEATIPLKIN